MKLKLTKTTVNSITKHHSTDKPVFVWDSTTTGFGIKINISGKAVYIAERKKNKKTQRSTIGNVSVFTLADARAKAKEFIADTTNRQILLSGLIEEYISVRTLSQRSIINYKSTTKYFPDVVISTITIQQVNSWYAGGKNRKTTIERAYRQLKALFNYAVATQLLSVSPFNSIINRWKIKPKSNHLEPASHLPKFWTSLVKRDSTTAKLIMIYLLTGLRKSELYKAKLTDGIITIEKTKNGTAHHIPTIDIMPLEVFEMDRSTWTQDVRKTIVSVAKEANVPVVTIHDLRRTVASLCAYLGIGLGEIKHLLNHSVKSDVTLSHYIQHRTDYLVPVMNKIEAYYKSIG